MANHKNFGLRGIGSDVQLGKAGGRLVFGNDRFDFTQADGVTLEDLRADTGTFTGNVDFTGNLVDGNAHGVAYFVTEALGVVNHDNDESVPTVAALIDYVQNVATTASLEFAGDTGGEFSIDLDTANLTLAGGTNINTVSTAGTLTVNLDSALTGLTSVTASGTIQGGTLTDGTLSITGGAVTGGTSATFSGAVQGDSLTDGTATITGGALTGVTNITASGTVDAGTVEFDNLSGTGAVTVTDIIDDDTFATASATTLATSESIQAYVDAEIAASAAGANLDLAGGTGTGAVNLETQVLTVAGTANEIETSAAGQTITVGLTDSVTIADSLTVTNSVSATDVTASDTVQGAAVVATANLTLNGFLVDAILDEDLMTSDSATAIPTQQSVKAYVDAEVANAASATDLDIAGGTGTGTVNLASQSLTVVGTINEIETSVSGQTITVGLVDSPIISGNLQIDGSLFSDDITAAQVTVDGDAVITGNLTVQGTQTIVDSVVVEIADAAIRVNSDGAAISAGLEANVGGTIESILFNPNAVIDPDSGETGAWVFSDDLIVNTTASLEDLVFTNLRASDNNDPNVISGFLSAAEGLTATDEKLPTANAVIEYVDSIVGGASITLEFFGDSGSDSLTLATGNLNFVGGTNLTSAVTNDAVTFNLDDNISLTSVTATGTVQGGTLTDGTLSSTAGTITGGVAATFSGTVQGGTLSDGAGFTATGGTATATTLTDGTLSINAGDISNANLINTSVLTASTVNFSNLSGTGAVSVTDILDDDTFGTASATTLATSESIKAYVDSQVGAIVSNISISDGVTTDEVLTGETITFTGNASSVTAVVSDNEVTFGLTDDVEIVNDLNVGGNITTGGGTGGSITGAALISANSFVATDNVTLNGFTITDILDEDDMISDSDTAIPTQQSVKAYVDAQVTAADLDFVGDSGTGAVDLDSQTLDIAGGTNITTVASGQTLTVNLDADISLTSVTATGAVEFGTLTDGTTSISDFVTAADTVAGNDNDTSVPTTAAVIDYVTNNSGDGLLRRAAWTANSSDTSFNIGTIPNIAGRTYYGARIKLKVNTALSGGGFDHVVVQEGGGAGTVLASEPDADAGVAGVYVIELDDDALTAGQAVVVHFRQANGTTPAAPSSGNMVAIIEYNWV